MNINKIIQEYESAARARQSFSKKTHIIMKLVFNNYLFSQTNNKKLKQEINFYQKRKEIRILQKELFKSQGTFNSVRIFLLLCLDKVLEEKNYNLTMAQKSLSSNKPQLSEFLIDLGVTTKELMGAIDFFNIDIVDFHKRRFFSDSNIINLLEHGYKMNNYELQYFKNSIVEFPYPNQSRDNIFQDPHGTPIIEKVSKKIEFLQYIKPQLIMPEQIELTHITESFNKTKNIYYQYEKLSEISKKDKLEQEIFYHLDILLDNIYNSYIIRLEKDFKIESTILEQKNKYLKMGK